MHRSYVCLSANRNHWRGNEKSWIRNRCIFSYSLLFLLKRMAVKTFAWCPVLLTLEISLMYWSQLAFDNTCWKKVIRMQETKWSQNESEVTFLLKNSCIQKVQNCTDSTNNTCKKLSFHRHMSDIFPSLSVHVDAIWCRTVQLYFSNGQFGWGRVSSVLNSTLKNFKGFSSMCIPLRNLT